MKTSIKTIIFVAASIFAATSCQKEAQNPVMAGETIQVSLNANLGDLDEADETKATAESVVRLRWAAGDKVQAYCGTTKISTGDGLAVTPSENGLFASLTGTINAPAAGKTITFVYSNGCAADGLTFDFSSQEKSSLPFVAYGTLEYDGSAITDKMVEFKFATSVMKIVTSNLEGGTISSVTVSGINTKVTLAPSESAAPGITGGTSGAIATTNFSAPSDGTRAIITVGLVPDNTASPKRKISVIQGLEQTADLTSAAIVGNKSYITPCVLDKNYVIIGGLKWATMNLGASTVAGSYKTCYGDLYQWGSVNTLYDGFPWTSATTISFTWKTGKSGGFIDGNSEYTWDDLTLPDTYDVVKQKIGNGWRLPTSAECQALYDACGGSYDKTTNPSGASISVGKGIYYCTSYDGVAGCLLCDGINKLFFPAAGGIEGNAPYAIGNYGCYWTSTRVSTSRQSAEALFFGGLFAPTSGYRRANGFSVRPVSDL